MVDFSRQWSAKAGLPLSRLIAWLGLARGKFYEWIDRYGRINEHNGLIPRDFWLEPWEREAIVGFALDHPLEGYRRLTFMMLDRDRGGLSCLNNDWRFLSDVSAGYAAN